MFNDLAVLSNQLLCLKTDKYWYCESEKDDDGVWHHPTKCYFMQFHWGVWKVRWRCGSALSEKRTEWIYIDLQNKILIWKPKLEWLFSKEYQYKKNSYEGKYYGINDIYGPWYVEHLDTMMHLEVFNIFNESNYERFTYPWQFFFFLWSIYLIT